VHTSSYVGFAAEPPEYPGSTFATPSSSEKTASEHQKQPLPNVANSNKGTFVRISKRLH
jgi:hypothetical protein